MARLKYPLLTKYQAKSNIHHTLYRHAYSGVANLVKIESFYSYEQIKFRNRLVDHINRPSF